MKRLFLVLSLVVALSVAFSSRTTAQENTSMGEIVVTATRMEEPRKDVSASVQIITQDDIKNSTAKNVGDLISESAIGHTQKYPGALTSKIGLRGYSTDLFSIYKSRVLILINGHYAGTVNLAKILVDDIERIEIVKGPASVLYGSQAMGGVINIITKRAKEEGFSGSILNEFGSWDYYKGAVEFNYKKSGTDLYFTASRSRRHDFKTKDYGEIKNSAYHDESLSLRIGYDFADDHRISFGFQHWKGWDIGDPGAIYSPDPDNFNNKSRNGIEISYDFESLKSSFFYVKDKDEWHGGMITGPGNSSITKKYTKTMGASIQNTFEFNIIKFVAGVDWNKIKVTSSRNTGAPYSPNSRYNTYGIFSEAKAYMFNNSLILNLGLRYDYFKNEILPTNGLTVTPRDEDLDHITVRGGLVYQVFDNFRLRASAGTGFRAPAPDELATDYVSSWGTHYVGNPDLNPEKSINYEAGFEFAPEFLRADFSFFHSRFKDKILNYYDAGINAMTWKNVDGATIQGWEASISYDIGAALGWDVSVEPFANVTYHTRYSAKDEDEINQYGKTLLYTPKWTGAFGIRAMGQRWDTRLIANYTGDERVMDWNWTSPTYGQVVKKGDFTVVNLKGSYRVHKNIEITASIENLLNRAYEYVKGYPMPKRTYYAGLRIVF
jgi:vitamin B12 transporter